MLSRSPRSGLITWQQRIRSTTEVGSRLLRLGTVLPRMQLFEVGWHPRDIVIGYLSGVDKCGWGAAQSEHGHGGIGLGLSARLTVL